MKIASSALMILALAACSDDGDSDGITVDIAVTSQNMPTAVTGATLDASYVTIVGFELTQCESLARTLWRAVDPLPSAFAHGEGSPTNLAVPVVVAIAGARDAVDAGKLEPPPGRYCGLTLALGAADDDAVALPDDDMIGKTLRVSGDHQGAPFTVTSAGNDHAHLTFAAPLELSATRTHAVVSVALDTSDAFDGVDYGSVSAAMDILSGLAAGFSVSVQ